MPPYILTQKITYHNEKPISRHIHYIHLTSTIHYTCSQKALPTKRTEGQYITHLINPNALSFKIDSGRPLQSSTKVIEPKTNIDLSPIHVQLFPNDSQSTYDTHLIDQPSGSEMDLMIIFYNEDELFERHKGKIINQ